VEFEFILKSRLEKAAFRSNQDELAQKNRLKPNMINPGGEKSRVRRWLNENMPIPHTP